MENKSAKIYQIQFEEKFFDVNVEECIKRDSNRKNPVGEVVIRSMYKNHLKPKNVKTDERFVLEQGPQLERCIICDIDGTLALMNGRNPFDESKYHTDKINIPVYNILQDYYQMSKIILVSGRMDTGREETVAWLEANKVPFDKLIMRKAKDFRGDDIVKKELYEEHIKDKFFVDFVLDDRDKVIEMWRSLGLLTLQVYYGDF